MGRFIVLTLMLLMAGSLTAQSPVLIDDTGAAISDDTGVLVTNVSKTLKAKACFTWVTADGKSWQNSKDEDWIECGCDIVVDSNRSFVKDDAGKVLATCNGKVSLIKAKDIKYLVIDGKTLPVKNGKVQSKN